jgi:ribosome-associated heat shock protein Hsp15
MRLDVLLFELRLFKSRSQASSAVQLGWVLLNGERTKPSREARVGDRVTLARPAGARGEATRTLEILGVPTASLSKEAARELVREVPAD